MSDNDNVKRKTLATLFALCPKGDEAADAIDLYLLSCHRISDALFVEAVASLMETWSWPNPPLPGDIHTRAVKLRIAKRRRDRETKRIRELEGDCEDAMTPVQAQRLLSELHGEPCPARLQDRIARKFREYALERVIARDVTPQLTTGGDAA